MYLEYLEEVLEDIQRVSMLSYRQYTDIVNDPAIDPEDVSQMVFESFWKFYTLTETEFPSLLEAWLFYKSGSSIHWMLTNMVNKRRYGFVIGTPDQYMEVQSFSDVNPEHHRQYHTQREEALISDIQSILTERELEIYDKYLAGLTQEEISDTYGIHRVSINRIIQSIKNKLREYDGKQTSS